MEGGAGLRWGKCHKTGHSMAECLSSDLPEVTRADRAGEVPGGRPRVGGGEATKDTKPPQTRSCQELAPNEGHIPQEDWVIKLNTEGGCAELVAGLLHQGADCPVCKLVHWYKRKAPWGETAWPSTCMESCPAFKAKTTPQRAKLPEDLGGCVLCTSWAHHRNLCHFVEPNNPRPGKTIKCQERSGLGVCGREH